MPKIVFVEDDMIFIHGLTSVFKQQADVECVTSLASLEQLLLIFHADIVIFDIDIGEENGIAMAKKVLIRFPDLAFGFLSGSENIKDALDAWEMGAKFFLKKPVDIKFLKEKILSFVSSEDLQPQPNLNEYAQSLKDYLLEFFPSDEKICLSTFKILCQRIEEKFGTQGHNEQNLALFSLTQGPVLIQGETGTGKEFFARKLFDNWKKQNHANLKVPFEEINCANLTSNLAGTELFGHEKGAFTDAHQSRKGAFERAAGGMLFLDEIGELSIDVQARILRVLEARAFQRVGGGDLHVSDAFVVFATHRDLEKDVAEGRFREDLYARILAFTETLPPLRHQPQRILPLFLEFFESEAKIVPAKNRPSTSVFLEDIHFSASLLLFMSQHTWSKNVREVKGLARVLYGTARLRAKDDERTSVTLTLDDIPASLKADPRTVEFCRNALIPARVVSDSDEHSLELTVGVSTSMQENTARSDFVYAVKNSGEPVSFKETIQNFESELIEWSLTECAGNYEKCAKFLGVPLKTLYAKKKVRKGVDSK